MSATAKKVQCSRIIKQEECGRHTSDCLWYGDEKRCFSKRRRVTKSPERSTHRAAIQRELQTLVNFIRSHREYLEAKSTTEVFDKALLVIIEQLIASVNTLLALHGIATTRPAFHGDAV